MVIGQDKKMCVVVIGQDKLSDVGCVYYEGWVRDALVCGITFNM